jgi:hypothetical protein
MFQVKCKNSIENWAKKDKLEPFLVLGSSIAELGSSAHAFECMQPRIDLTPTIMSTTAKLKRSVLKRTSLGSSALGRAQYGKHLLIA